METTACGRLGLALIISLGGFSQVIKTWAWRQTFMCDISGLSWARSLGTQLASDAMGQLGFAGKLVGEGIRVSLLGSALPLASRISASAIDGGLHILTAAVVTASGNTATLLLAPLSAQWRVDALMLAVVLIALVILAVVAIARRWQLMGNMARVFGRLPRLHKWISGKQPVVMRPKTTSSAFVTKHPHIHLKPDSQSPMACARSFGGHLILRFMGARIPVIGAFVVEGLTKVINLIGAFNPGNLGTYEAGNMLIAKMFGVTGTAGLTLALCRRVRAALWAGVGAICLIVMKRAAGQDRGECPCSNQDLSRAVLN